MKINRGDSQDKGSQSRQAYHAAPAPTPKRPVQPDPDPQDLYEDAEGPDEYAEDDDDEPVRRRFPIGLVVLVVILAIVGIGGWKVFQFYGEVAGNGELGPEQTVTIEQGSTVADITNVLKEDGVIQYDWLFKLYAKYSGRASGLQYGDFTLRSGMDYNTILKTLSVQQVKRKTITITFPEGYTAVAIAQKMEENGLCSVDDFLACANGEDGSDFSQYDFWNAIPDTEGRLMKCEGYLFPDTYEFYKNHNAKNALGKLIDAFADRIDEDAFASSKAKSMGYSMKDVVIIASLIEKETDGTDQRDIASVIYNRLQKPGETAGLLQIDASLLYGLPDHTGAITNADKAVDTPYNLYLHKGLPPTAIANPGSAALKAAMDPNDTDYYYYALGTDGKHHFSKTLSEHNAFVGSSSYGG